jgi:hypothetical protein
MLQAQIGLLKSQLENANQQLDNNFSRLEAAGFGSVRLAEKLAAALERIGELEDQIRSLLQKNKASALLVSAGKNGASSAI